MSIFSYCTGWQRFNDTANTSGSPLVISPGARVQITNNAGTTDTSQSPQNAPLFWAGDEIRPEFEGDSYELRLDFKLTTFATNVNGTLEIDVNGTAVIQRNITIARGAGTYSQSVGFPITIDADFKTYGGAVYFDAATGDSFEIYDFIITIIRIHRAVNQ